MKTTYCLDCESSIELSSSLGAGSLVECSFCEAQFEIIDVDPIELDWTYDGSFSYEEIVEEEEEVVEEEEELYQWAWKLAKPSRSLEYGQLHERRLPNHSTGRRRDHERRKARKGHYRNADHYEY